jgi:hypothetical protein
MSLKRLLRRVRACTICEAALPLGARPILQPVLLCPLWP